MPQQPETAKSPGAPAAVPAVARSTGEVSACWSHTGVYGTGTCPELRKFIHCRNCPVYSSAGVRLLNRPLPADYRRDWTEHFAVRKASRESAHSSVIMFRIQSEWLGLPTQYFQEVAEKRQIHSLPHRRDGLVLGITNVRGEILVCVALGRLLGLQKAVGEEPVRAGTERLLVANWESNRVAFPVEEVQGPQRVNLQELQTPPAALGRARLAFTRQVMHWRQRTICLLDPDVLFATLNHDLA
jgi:chemotaxis-related protein WspD